MLLLFLFAASIQFKNAACLCFVFPRQVVEEEEGRRKIMMMVMISMLMLLLLLITMMEYHFA